VAARHDNRPRGHQALAAARQARAAVPMTRRVVRGPRRAAGRTIVAYRRGDRAPTNYEIAPVTVALQHLKAKDDPRARTDPVQRRLYTDGSAGATRARGGARVPARLAHVAVALNTATAFISTDGLACKNAGPRERVRSGPRGP
jgi:hypothetical protein